MEPKYKSLNSSWEMDEIKLNKFPWKIISIYLIVGLLWIIFSDRILAVIISDYEMYLTFQTYKGEFYVIATAILFFFLIKIDYSKIINLTREVYVKNQELLSYSEELIAIDEELNQKINSLHLTMNDLYLQKQFVNEIYNNSNTAIIIWNLKGEIVEVNCSFIELFEFKSEEIIGKKWFDLIVPKEERKNVSELIHLLRKDYSVKKFENKVITKNGKVLDMIWNYIIMQNPQNNELVVTSFGIDITTEKENERKAYELAFKDKLTGLKNRTSFEYDAVEMIDSNSSFTLYYLDFDNFKNLNDVHGHKYGDLFLKRYSEWLSNIFSTSSIYRWCGDEFLIIEKDVTESRITERIEQIMGITKKRWKYKHIEYYPSVSIGITKFPLDAGNVGDLLKNIDIALHNAKENGKSRASKYEERFQKEIESRITIENLINTALLNNNFKLNYQPIYDLLKNQISAIEVLLRWHSEELNISTVELIAVAEQTGQIINIDRWVVESAFKFINDNLKDKNIITSINLSAKSINSSDLIEYLKDCLERFNVNPSNIQFELTEHSLINDIEQTNELIKSLKLLGFKISLDDFGTRYSSLNYLSNIPFDSLKIDKSYVDKIIETDKNKVIVEQIIQLSKRLGLKTIAEGIELEEQLNILRELGCDFGQGYLLAKPMELYQLLELVDTI